MLQPKRQLLFGLLALFAFALPRIMLVAAEPIQAPVPHTLTSPPGSASLDDSLVTVPGPLPQVSGVFAVGNAARKALPPRDCLRCTGPNPCVPCDGHHQGFLYYGTDPAADDCTNSLEDCPHGNCGGIAAGISRLWIQLHKTLGGAHEKHGH